MLLKEELPTYKIEMKGTFSMSDVELLSLVIGADEARSMEIARTMLSTHSSLTAISKLSIYQISKYCYPREAKRIVASFELARRKNCEAINERPRISSSRDAYNQIAELLNHLPHEEFWVLVINRANEVIKKIRLSVGGTCGTVVDTKILMRTLIEEKATAFIAVHNHPSGNLNPSQADNEITKKLSQAGYILDIKLLDHLIVSERGYYSYAYEGMI